MNMLIYLFPGILKIDVVRADLYRYYGKIDKTSFNKAMRIPGFKFTLYFRLCALYPKFSLLGAIARWKNSRLFVRYGFQIPRKTNIGKGLRISHFGGVVVNYDAVIGSNCYLSHNITIGQSLRGKSKGSPVIGDRVWIGPGAVIVGKVVIGDNVLIAPNSYVNVDIPSNSIVLGNPAKIIEKANATDGYLTNIYFN